VSNRGQQQRLVTKKLILKIKELVEKNNSKFVVVALSLNMPNLITYNKYAKSDYIQFFKKHNIGFIDCEFINKPFLFIA